VKRYVEEKPFWGNFKETIKRNTPHFFTMGNLALGVLALLYALESQFELSISLILIAMVLDGVDGKLALKLKVSSELGKQLDSLSDLVSFGAAPAVLFYAMYFHQAGVAGLLLTLLFPLAGAYRLARFNIVSGDASCFKGLPITIAGGALAAMAIHPVLAESWPALLLVLSLVFLMTSKVPYPAPKKGQQEANPFIFLAFYMVVIGFIIVVLLVPELVIYLLASYIVFGFLSGFLKLLKDAEEPLLSLPWSNKGNM